MKRYIHGSQQDNDDNSQSEYFTISRVIVNPLPNTLGLIHLCLAFLFLRSFSQLMMKWMSPMKTMSADSLV